MKALPSESRYWVPIVGHAIRTIEIFEDADTHLTLQEVTVRSGISKSSVFRILYTLESLGYVRKDPETRKYHLGLRILEIAQRMRATQTIVQLARPYMRELQARFMETVNLAVLQGKDIYYVEIMDSSQAFRMTAEVGSRAPFHATAVGKAIAAGLSPKQLTVLLAGERFQRFTDNTLTSRATFNRVLTRVRKQGFALDNEEMERGASCVAVAISDGEGHATHALSVSGPTHRIRAHQKVIIRELRRVSSAITASLK